MDQKWRENALCVRPMYRQMDDKGKPLYSWDTDQHPTVANSRAVLVCGKCPVQDECLSWSLENREPTGIWAGHDVDARNRLLRGMSQRAVRV
jgi:hypothetical protein